MVRDLEKLSKDYAGRSRRLELKLSKSFFSKVIRPKSDKMKYVGMMDMNVPVPMVWIHLYDGTLVDGIRVIFKKKKILPRL